MRFRPALRPDSDLHYCEVTNTFHVLQSERQAASLDPQFACGLTPEASWVWMTLMRLSNAERAELVERTRLDSRSTFICPDCWRLVR